MSVRAKKGSKKWIQVLINYHENLINEYLKKKISFVKDEEIKWVSPVIENGFKEHQLHTLIRKHNIQLQRPLIDFWPEQGAQWDALGISRINNETKKIFLVEAKSHIPELLSDISKNTKMASKRKIRYSLEQTKYYLNAKPDVDWTSGFYQYTNRLAHLYFLKEQNGLPAYLLFIYFTNDDKMKGPKTKDEWLAALKLLYSHLGIGKHKLQKNIMNIYIDVNKLKRVSDGTV